MPGLSQLKQFNKDILSLGDEITLRAARGEKPVKVPIPATVKDVNDSEDFVIGMPENPVINNDSTVDDDLSELTDLVAPKASGGEETKSETPYEAPDMSSLLSPAEMDMGSSEDSMPDLSMFMDEPAEEEIEAVQEKPEEISVADMGLEALLAGAGFDGSEGAEDEQQDSDFENDETPEELEEVTDLEAVDIDAEEPAAAEPVDDGLSEIERDLLNFNGGSSESTEPVMDPNIASLFDEPASEPEAASETEDLIGNLDSVEEPDTLEELAEAEPIEELPDNFDSDAAFDNEEFDLPAADDAGEIEELSDDFSGDLDSALTDTFDVPEVSDFDLENADDIQMEGADDFASLVPQTPADEAPDLGDLEDLGEQNDSFNLDDIEALGSTDFDTENTVTEIADNEDFGSEEFGNEDISSEDFGSEDFGNEDFASEDSESDDFDTDGLDSFDEPAVDSADGLDLPSIDGMDGGLDSFGSMDFMGESAGDILDSVTSEIPDFDTDISDMDIDEDTSFDDPVETFDTSAMDGVDFDIPDDAGSSDFEMGKPDEFAMEGSDFEIPGFSDVKIAKDNVAQKKLNVNLDEPDFSQGIPGNELPPNTLSNEQYKTFLKNLNEYPLNVRLAFEEFIVQDEFTDDAEFEIIEKILKKAPARQVAATLEKMLDTSIPVPRDYEHRTAEEYEAYKKSLQYQLKNKILPGLIGLVVLCFVGWGLFVFGKNCIYKPVKASNLYKQGYALLEAEEYPQSEIYFNKATGYRLSKKWFFNYARGYRNHRQYQKSAEMYEKILRMFKQDKEAGLEYAEMEFSDLANYERSEEILKRQVLDYHVNDPEADLMLGDVYLEWGTEKDPSKLDFAAQQYQKLLMSNGGSDLYNSRMMRYYIRTDNLVAVLNYKERFLNKEKSLAGEDWTELSGYMLEKLYGPLAPADEYLRSEIEDVRKLLLRAVKMDPENPISYYNLGNYYVETNDIYSVEGSLNEALKKFNDAERLKRKDIYKYIDTYRLLGENFIKQNNILRAQEQYTNGITLYTTEKENGGLEGNEKVGLLYADLADINYFSANDYDNALRNYISSIDLGNDNSMIRYRVGYINYKNKKYQEALYSFKKAGEGNVKEKNLLLAMGNTLSLKNDDYSAEAAYSQLINRLDEEIEDKGIVLSPQTLEWDNEVVTTYLYAANNYGVTCWNLAKRTGDSSKNRDALVYLERSIKAWDALTRNQNTLVRQAGSNLAQENMKYMTHPVSDYEPAIYIDIPKTLTNNESL